MAEPSPPDAPTPARVPRIGADLGPRVISAIVMAIIALGATFAGPVPFEVLVLAVCGIVSWEWGRIVRGGEFDLVSAAHLGSVIAAIVLAAMGQVVLALLVTVVGAILVGLMSFGRHVRLSSLGVPYAALGGIALIWLRGDPAYGLKAVLFVVLIVAVTDVGAYFSGRLLGGPKLWPRVSPNKTWAGLLGAVAASALAAALFAKVVPASSLRLALLGAVLAVVAQAGDLGESALKRRFGAKDASNIIPGHGGVMDRVDGLITAAIFAAIYAAFINVHAPARALFQ